MFACTGTLPTPYFQDVSMNIISVLLCLSFVQYLAAFTCAVPKFRTAFQLTRTKGLFAAPPNSAEKVRVKLLEDITAVGKKGEIVMVSRTHWLNVLQPRKIAQQISDTQLAKLEQEAKASAVKQALETNELFSSLSTLPMIRLARKAGPNMQLFGAVTAKAILDDIKHHLPTTLEKTFTQKSIVIKDIAERPTDAMKAHTIKIEVVAGTGKLEIRRIGQYDVKLQVPGDRTFVVKLEVVPE